MADFLFFNKIKTPNNKNASELINGGMDTIVMGLLGGRGFHLKFQRGRAQKFRNRNPFPIYRVEKHDGLAAVSHHLFTLKKVGDQHHRVLGEIAGVDSDGNPVTEVGRAQKSDVEVRRFQRDLKLLEHLVQTHAFGRRKSRQAKQVKHEQLSCLAKPLAVLSPVGRFLHVGCADSHRDDVFEKSLSCHGCISSVMGHKPPVQMMKKPHSSLMTNYNTLLSLSKN